MFAVQSSGKVDDKKQQIEKQQIREKTRNRFCNCIAASCFAVGSVSTIVPILVIMAYSSAAVDAFWRQLLL